MPGLGRVRHGRECHRSHRVLRQSGVLEEPRLRREHPELWTHAEVHESVYHEVELEKQRVPRQFAGV